MSESAERLEVGAEIKSAPYLLDDATADAYRRALDSPPRRRQPKNIHSDAVAASRAGFTAPIAAGEQTLAVIAEFLAAKFGARFTRGGRIEVTLTRPVFYGDTIVSHAVAAEMENGLIRLNIWVENQHRERVLEGVASVRAEA
jgi:acyl dehydratase